MTKSIVLAIAALSIGLVVGVLGAHQKFASEVRQFEAYQSDAEMEKAKLAKAVQALEDQLAQSAAENSQLREASDAAQKAAETVSPAAESVSLESLLGGAAPENAGDSATRPKPVTGAETAAEPAPAQEGESSEEQARRTERRQEFMTQMREGIQTFMEAEAAKTSDPSVAERLNTLSDYAQQQLDLVQQLREAPTDEERDAIRQAMADLRENTRVLVQDQQDYLLRQVASQYGISDLSQQDSFVQAMRQTQQSPFFRMGGNVPGLFMPGAARVGAGPGRDGNRPRQAPPPPQ